jgi:lipoprotein-anchoring transpeptidase ErfK/SrfK
MRYSVGVNGIVGQKMTVALVAVAALALPPVVRGEESDKRRPAHEVATQVGESGKPRPADEVSALIKQTYPYASAVAQKKEETKEPDAQVVTMEAFTVVESKRSRELEKKIESENEKMKAEKFSITKGGTIWKKGRVELGAWGARGGINFFKLSW